MRAALALLVALTAPASAAPAADPVAAALDLLASGRAAQAEAQMSLFVALPEGTRNAGAWNALGLAHHAQAEWAPATAAFEKAADLLPKDPRIRANLGSALLESGRLDRAASELRASAAADPAYAKPRLLLGRVLVLLGDAEGAEDALREATRLAPEEPVGWYHLGLLLLQQRRPTEAVTALTKCLELSPDMPSAHLNLGLALRRAGRDAEARRHLERFRELSAATTTP